LVLGCEDDRQQRPSGDIHEILFVAIERWLDRKLRNSLQRLLPLPLWHVVWRAVGWLIFSSIWRACEFVWYLRMLLDGNTVRAIRVCSMIRATLLGFTSERKGKADGSLVFKLDFEGSLERLTHVTSILSGCTSRPDACKEPQSDDQYSST